MSDPVFIEKIEELKNSCAANISELFPVRISGEEIEELSVSPDSGPPEFIEGVFSYSGEFYGFVLGVGLPSAVTLSSNVGSSLAEAFPFLPKGTLRTDPRLKSLVFSVGKVSFLTEENQGVWAISRYRK